MNLDTLIAPAVVAAIVSGLIATIATIVNRSTSLTTHREKLRVDHELAEKKLAGDMALAKRKFSLDLQLADWKRRTEVAEQVLADFYKAKSIFEDARRPFALAGEGATRPNRGKGETEDEAISRDAIYAPYERLTKERDFFSEMHSRRYRFMALFGEQAREPFLVFLRAYSQVGTATFSLLGPNGRNLSDTLRQKYADCIGWHTDDEDQFAKTLNSAVTQVEVLCAPVLRATVDKDDQK